LTSSASASVTCFELQFQPASAPLAILYPCLEIGLFDMGAPLLRLQLFFQLVLRLFELGFQLAACLLQLASLFLGAFSGAWSLWSPIPLIAGCAGGARSG